MKVHIRQFTPADYSAMLDINNAVYPEYPRSLDELRFHDEHRDPRCKDQRWVAEYDQRVVAYASYDQWPDMYHPRKFSIDIDVHPMYQSRGIGSALYYQLLGALKSFDPLSLRAHAREDYPSSLEFLRKRGFEEDKRDWESRLYVAAFNFSPYEGHEENVCSQGVEIKTFGQLEDDNERDRKIYELDCEVVKDEPSPEPHTRFSYDHFVERILNHPNLLPDGFFVAVKDGEYVGMSSVWASQGNDDLYTGQTGVKRAYRRRGIALALKLRGIAYAKARGNPIIKTWNDSTNRAILSINERLGFVKQPAWIEFVKILQEEGP